jgi:hypothetical protein
MTHSDLGSRSRSTIHILEHCLVVGNLHVKLEDSSSITTEDIKQNVKLGQWPIHVVTFKVVQGQLYTCRAP